MKRLFKFTSKASKDIFLKAVDNKKLKELSETELEYISAEMGPEDEDEHEEMCSKKEVECMMQELYSYMSYYNEYVRSELSYLYSMWNRHQEGHLPNVGSSEQMQRVVENLGLSDEFEVAKKVIYASSKDRSGDLLLELVNDKN